MAVNHDEPSDTIAHVKVAILLMLMCAVYACAVQYSLVSDIILIHAARRVPTETGRLLKRAQTSLQRNLGEEAATPYLLRSHHK